MRLTVGSLEEARRNPQAYKQRQEAGEKRIFTFGYQQALECAILRFHKRNQSIDEARQQLREYCLTKFTNQWEINNTLVKFEEYVASYTSLGNVTAKTRHDMHLSVPSGQPNDFQLTGRIPRLDITPAGDLVAWIFSKESRDWYAELRFPLVKLAMATELDRDIDEVLIGVYCFEDGNHHYLSFAPDQVEDALAEVQAIFQQIV